MIYRKYRKLDAAKLISDDIDEDVLTIDVSANGLLQDESLLSFIKVYFQNEQCALDCKNTSCTLQELNRKGMNWIS